MIERNIIPNGPSRLFIVNYFSTNKDNLLKKNVFHKEMNKQGIWVWKEEEYTSFSEFKKASKSDKDSSYVNPGYKHADNYDFNLTNDSPALEIVE